MNSNIVEALGPQVVHDRSFPVVARGDNVLW